MKKQLTPVVLVFFLIGLGSATTISDENVTVNLEDDSVLAELDVELLTTETFNYQTSHPVNDLLVEINGERADCNVEKLVVGATINCETGLKENFSVDISYTTDGLVDSQGAVSTFRYSQSIYRPIRSYNFKVILPEGTGVVDQEDATTSVISPAGGEVGNMNGRRFFVEWDRNPELGRSQNFRVLFEPFEGGTGFDLSFVPGSLAALLVVLGVVYFVYRRKGEVAASNVIDELGEDERLVIEMLRDSEGEMLQKDIVEDSEYSKAKISGVVSSLVDTDVVTKEKEGRSNKVSLKDKFRG